MMPLARIVAQVMILLNCSCVIGYTVALPQISRPPVMPPTDPANSGKAGYPNR